MDENITLPDGFNIKTSDLAFSNKIDTSDKFKLNVESSFVKFESRYTKQSFSVKIKWGEYGKEIKHPYSIRMNHNMYIKKIVLTTVSTILYIKINPRLGNSNIESDKWIKDLSSILSSKFKEKSNIINDLVDDNSFEFLTNISLDIKEKFNSISEKHKRKVKWLISSLKNNGVEI